MAQQARGYMSKLHLEFEKNFAQNITTLPRVREMPFNKLDLKSEQTIINPATITGTRNAVEPARGHIAVSGGVTVPVDTAMFPNWLVGLFGDAVTTSNAVVDDKGVVTTPATQYSHVFKITNNQPSFTAYKMFDDISTGFLYRGCKINSLKMTVGDDGELTADMDLLGADEEIKGTETVKDPISGVDTTNYASARQYTPTDIVNAPIDRVNNFQATLMEDGVKTANIKTMDIELKMGLDDSQYVLGCRGRGDIPEGLVEVSGTMKAIFNSASVLQKGIDATETKLELKLENGDSSITFLFPEVQYERTSPTIDGPAGVEAEFKFSAYYKDSAEKSAVVVTVVNDKVAYGRFLAMKQA